MQEQLTLCSNYLVQTFRVHLSFTPTPYLRLWFKVFYCVFITGTLALLFWLECVLIVNFTIACFFPRFVQSESLFRNSTTCGYNLKSSGNVGAIFPLRWVCACACVLPIIGLILSHIGLKAKAVCHSLICLHCCVWYRKRGSGYRGVVMYAWGLVCMKWKYFDAIAAGFSIQDDCRPLRRLERWRGSQWTSFSSSTATLKPQLHTQHKREDASRRVFSHTVWIHLSCLLCSVQQPWWYTGRQPAPCACVCALIYISVGSSDKKCHWKVLTGASGDYWLISPNLFLSIVFSTWVHTELSHSTNQPMVCRINWSVCLVRCVRMRTRENRQKEAARM